MSCAPCMVQPRGGVIREGILDVLASCGWGEGECISKERVLKCLLVNMAFFEGREGVVFTLAVISHASFT